MSYKVILFTALIVLYSASSYSQSFRISPQLLNKLVDSKKVVVLDVGTKPKYDLGHITNAISFPVELTYENKKINGKVQQPKQMQKYLRERGVDINSTIIVYDGGILIDAARVFWTLEVYGFKKVKILDQGFSYWQNSKLSVSREQPKVKPSEYVANINHQRLASKFTTQLATHNKKMWLIDARPRSSYIGKNSVAKRFGHIPSAKNIPFFKNFTKSSNYSSLKSIDELKKIYAHIPKNRKIIIYCKIGRVSSANYFALRELGYNVSNYDASWREWGNDESLPIEK